jgi:hypothetical protein
MKILKVRFMQIRRELSNLGFGFIVLFVIYFALLYSCYLLFQDNLKSLLLLSLLAFALFSIHIFRRDKKFVLINFNNPHNEFFIEYFVLSLPLTSICLVTKNWFLFFAFIPIIFLISFVKFDFKQVTYFKKISQFIPAYYFECISGFRKSFAPIILLYVASIIFSWSRIFPLILLWFIVLQIVSFFSECEPLQMLLAEKENAKEFIDHKLRKHTILLLKIILPIVIVNIVFNFSDWLVIVAFLVEFIALLCFAICYKYACYIPNDISFSKSIIISLITFCSVVPYLFPIPIIFGVIYYYKAIENLKPYFND